MQCQTCGHQLSPDERFCPDCGTPVPAATQEMVPPLSASAWPATPPAPGVAPPTPVASPEQWPRTATPDAWTPAPAFGQPPPAPYGMPPAVQPPIAPWGAQHPGAGTPSQLADLPPGWSGGFQGGSGSFGPPGDGRPVMLPRYGSRPSSSGSTSAIVAVVAVLVILALVGIVLAGVGNIGPLAGIFTHHTTATTTQITTTGSTSTAPTAVPTTAPTVAPTTVPTATTVTASCASVLPGAGIPSAGSRFGDVPFPANAATTNVIIDSSATGSYTIAHVAVCAPNSSFDQLRLFYSQAMPAHGWVAPQDNKIPYQDDYFVRCDRNVPQNLCWGKDSAPRYVVLTNVQDAGNNLVTYTLQLFTPPPAPACGGAFAGLGITEFWTVQNPTWYVPLPPLSHAYKVTLGGGSTQVFVCSAGTAASVQNELNTNMPNQFWSPSGSNTWTGGGFTLTFNINDPTNWSFTY